MDNKLLVLNNAMSHIKSIYQIPMDGLKTTSYRAFHSFAKQHQYAKSTNMISQINQTLGTDRWQEIQCKYQCFSAIPHVNTTTWFIQRKRIDLNHMMYSEQEDRSRHWDLFNGTLLAWIYAMHFYPKPMPIGLGLNPSLKHFLFSFKWLWF